MTSFLWGAAGWITFCSVCSSCCSPSSLDVYINRWHSSPFSGPSCVWSWLSRLIHISLITHFVAPPPPPAFPSFTITTGKTTPTSASTTYHGAALPKETGDPERGTGPDGPPPVGEQGSPDSEPISVEMEGKGEGHLSSVNLQGDCTTGPLIVHF